MLAADIGQGARCQSLTLSGTSLMLAANIFQSCFLTLRPTSSSDVGEAGRHSCQRQPPIFLVQFFDTQANVGHQRRRERQPAGLTLATNIGLSVKKLDQQCQRPTLANTQADNQSITLVFEQGDGVYPKEKMLQCTPINLI